ncbi:MAG: ABC transporter ATP-binding protein [Candidatus Calescibacterium sp.]|nr:ABC transporter ATP-binding protein [Candidatus Calescibacterium sp.]MCX7971867.1 ABC transporter ATP-binding protein [bacterium]MDW8195034.1 ABC transporter ATP-binding protein [Candidatus Calescibacterium sp.]
MLEVQEVYKTYRRGKQLIHALRGLSFVINQNESFALIGPNGAGKTTTIKAILNLITLDRGKITIDGKDVSVDETRRYIGYAPEIPYYPTHIPAIKLLKTYLDIYGVKVSQEKIEYYFELVKLKNYMNSPLSNYSKGMLQRFSILQAIITEPKLLILDELTSGLDPIGQYEIIEIVKNLRNKTTILFTSHNLAEVEQICDKVLIINKGRAILYSPIQDLKNKHPDKDLYQIFFDLIMQDNQRQE